MYYFSANTYFDFESYSEIAFYVLIGLSTFLCPSVTIEFIMHVSLSATPQRGIWLGADQIICIPALNWVTNFSFLSRREANVSSLYLSVSSVEKVFFWSPITHRPPTRIIWSTS